jgi:hypothetical protein
VRPIAWRAQPPNTCAAPDHPEARVAMHLIGQLYDIDEKAGDDLVRKGELRRTE